MPPRYRRIQPPSPQPPQTCVGLVHPNAAPERQTALALLRDLSSGQNRPIQHTRESSCEKLLADSTISCRALTGGSACCLSAADAWASPLSVMLQRIPLVSRELVR